MINENKINTIDTYHSSPAALAYMAGINKHDYTMVVREYNINTLYCYIGSNNSFFVHQQVTI